MRRQQKRQQRKPTTVTDIRTASEITECGNNSKCADFDSEGCKKVDEMDKENGSYFNIGA